MFKIFICYLVCIMSSVMSTDNTFLFNQPEWFNETFPENTTNIIALKEQFLNTTLHFETNSTGDIYAVYNDVNPCDYIECSKYNWEQTNKHIKFVEE